MIYNIDEIKTKLNPTFNRYGVRKAILFGSYAKGIAKENSDIDIVVDSGLKGLKFVGLINEVSKQINKDVDLIDVSHIESGSPVEEEILESGVLIYEE